MSELTGTAALTRFALRRDRVRILVWIGAIVILVVSTAASVKGLYPTQADLDDAAATAEGSAAARALNGPAVALDTLGGQVAFQIGAVGLVVVGLMSTFMIGRLGRAEEEAGRTELVRSLPVGRNAPGASALLVVAAMNVALAGLIALGLMSQDLPAAGSVAFGASYLAAGLVFAGVTTVASQVTENTRVVNGASGAVIGLAYALRAAGDAGSGSLSWLSPIGWSQKVRPFAGEDWWPLALGLGAFVALVAVAVSLASRRDLGAGLVPPRPGPLTGSPALGSPFGLALRLQRAGLLAWSVGVLLVGVSYGSIGNEVEDIVSDSEAMEEVLARAGGDITESYLSTATLVTALIGAGFAVQATLRLRSEETDVRAEPVLATPVSRRAWAGSHLVVALAGSLVVLLAGGLGVGVTYGLVSGDLAEAPRLVGAALAYAPAVWVLAGLAAALFGLVPRVGVAVWAGLAACFLIGMFADVLGLPSWATGLSPFEHVPLLPAAEMAVPPLVVLAAIAAGLMETGVRALARRDVG